MEAIFSLVLLLAILLKKKFEILSFLKVSAMVEYFPFFLKGYCVIVFQVLNDTVNEFPSKSLFFICMDT